MRSRVTWDQCWMATAEILATRSRCEGAQVGAVIVDADNRPVSSGYNGPPSRFDVSRGEYCGAWCERQRERLSGSLAGRAAYGLSCPSVHAESNALMFADRRDWLGGTIYVTGAVCQDCAKLVAQSGLARVVMRVSAGDRHRDPERVTGFLRECGLRVVEVEGSAR